MVKSFKNFNFIDLPTFFGSSYSVVKGFTDRLVGKMYYFHAYLPGQVEEEESVQYLGCREVVFVFNKTKKDVD